MAVFLTAVGYVGAFLLGVLLFIPFIFVESVWRERGSFGGRAGLRTAPALFHAVCGRHGKEIFPLRTESFAGTQGGVCATLTVSRIRAGASLFAAASGVLGVLCLWRDGWTAAAAADFLFLLFLTAVAYADAETMEIPDEYVLLVAMAGTLAIPLQPEVTVLSRLIGVFAVSVPLFLLALAVPGGFGGGDIKLMAAAGWFLGWRNVLLGALCGILLGGVYGIVLLASRRKGRREHFAFGPFLALGMAVSVVCGENLAALYARVFDLSRYFA